LWEGIEAVWPPWATMLITGLAFWSMHVPIFADVWVAGVFLVFVTVLTLLRRYCGSVWASLILHIIWNAVVILDRGIR
jgi:membrane protease YdiL (CAAX protease family)